MCRDECEDCTQHLCRWLNTLHLLAYMDAKAQVLCPQLHMQKNESQIESA